MLLLPENFQADAHVTQFTIHHAIRPDYGPPCTGEIIFLRFDASAGTPQVVFPHERPGVEVCRNPKIKTIFTGPTAPMPAYTLQMCLEAGLAKKLAAGVRLG